MGQKSKWEYFKAIYDRYQKATLELRTVIFRRVLPDMSLQSQIRHSQAEWASARKAVGALQYEKRSLSLWSHRHFDLGSRMGGCRLSLWTPSESHRPRLASMDSQTVSFEPGFRKTTSFHQRPATMDRRLKPRKSRLKKRILMDEPNQDRF